MEKLAKVFIGGVEYLPKEVNKKVEPTTPPQTAKADTIEPSVDMGKFMQNVETLKNAVAKGFDKDLIYLNMVKQIGKEKALKVQEEVFSPTTPPVVQEPEFSFN